MDWPCPMASDAPQFDHEIELTWGDDATPPKLMAAGATSPKPLIPA